VVFVTTELWCCVQAGLRPICEFMTFNFSMQGIDQVVLMLFFFDYFFTSWKI